MVKINNPREAMRYNLAYLPESRKEAGLVVGQSVRHNAALPSLDQRHQWGFVKKLASVSAQAYRLD